MKHQDRGWLECGTTALVVILSLSAPAFCQSGDGTHLDAPFQVIVKPMMFEGYSAGEKIKPDQREAFTALFSSMMEGEPPRYLSCQYVNSRGEQVGWYGFWKDSPPENIEDMLKMVEPKHPLQTISLSALSACPQTMSEAAAISGSEGIVAAQVGTTGEKTPAAPDTELAEEVAKGLSLLLGKAIENAVSPPSMPEQDGAPACGREFQISPSRRPCGNRWQPSGSWPAELWCYTDFSFQVGGNPGATFCTNGRGDGWQMTGILNRCAGVEGWCNQ